MTAEEQAELEINVAADPDNGPIYIAAVERYERDGRGGSDWPSVVAVIVVAAFICWLILRR